jgi:hypothetical protein
MRRKMRMETETKKRGPGRPKGSKNKKTLQKLVREEISPADVIKQDAGDVVLPSDEMDAVEELLGREEEEAPSTLYYKATATLPKVGNFYVMKIIESNQRSRILISHLDFNDSFPLSTRKVVTKYGIADGLSCPVVMRFIDIITDPETEEPIGIYHVISTPTMVRTGIDPRKIAAALTLQSVEEQMDEYNKHKALSYKMQRDLWRKRAEIYEESYKELAEKRMEISEELAATAIEMLVNAIMASKEIFDEIRKKNMPWYKRYMTELLLLIGAIFIIYLVASGSIGG